MWRVRCDLLQSVADGGVLRLRVVATMSARLAMAHRGACLAWRSGVACARARVFRRRLGSLARTRLARRISRQSVCHTDVGTWRIARLTPRACLVRELVHGIGAPSAGWRGTCSTWYVVVRFGIYDNSSTRLHCSRGRTFLFSLTCAGAHQVTASLLLVRERCWMARTTGTM